MLSSLFVLQADLHSMTFDFYLELTTQEEHWIGMKRNFVWLANGAEMLPLIGITTKYCLRMGIVTKFYTWVRIKKNC